MVLAIRRDNDGAVAAVAKLSAGLPVLRASASELALVIASGTLAPDIVEHISGVSNVIPDLLSKSWVLPTSLREVTRRICLKREKLWRTVE